MEQTKRDLGLVVGANLKCLIRESACRTQEEFAFCFGIDVRTVCRWVNQGVYSLATVEQLAAFFNIDPLALLS